MSYDINNVTPRPWMVSGRFRNIENKAGTWIAQPYGQGLLGTPEEPEEVAANAAHIVKCVNAHEALVEALRRLSNAELLYRQSHNLHGPMAMETGRSWDGMRKAGEHARALLESLK